MQRNFGSFLQTNYAPQIPKVFQKEGRQWQLMVIVEQLEGMGTGMGKIMTGGKGKKDRKKWSLQKELTREISRD
jgi:hypothetical protein